MLQSPKVLEGSSNVCQKDVETNKPQTKKWEMDQMLEVETRENSRQMMNTLKCLEAQVMKLSTENKVLQMENIYLKETKSKEIDKSKRKTIQMNEKNCENEEKNREIEDLKHELMKESMRMQLQEEEILKQNY
ncbi:101 kDa malaria antigen-like [Anneissia japonica]|uniref:101 kDa malaria antigen-like n=1 Tax=Anneissia japonica TaxID=1529436 RepID=UPI001425B26D|nr:101 kDa malaria antigen-like [Anneissia japonica]